MFLETDAFENLRHLRHPDITVGLWQVNEDLVPGDAEVRLGFEVSASTPR